jgi:hypothetical protein
VELSCDCSGKSFLFGRAVCGEPSPDVFALPGATSGIEILREFFGKQSLPQNKTGERFLG